MYMPLPPVTIDIVGENYKKGAIVNYKKRAFNPFD